MTTISNRSRPFLKLLSCVAIVCILIAVFGVFSLVTLACEQRRKEIAIRKVNGATLGNIPLDIYKRVPDTVTLRLVPCFPGQLHDRESVAGELCRTNQHRRFDVCHYLYRNRYHHNRLYRLEVWKAARENPAEVVKTE